LSQSVTGDNPVAIMVTPNGQQIYTAGSDFQSSLSEIDVTTGKVNGVPCLAGLGCEVSTMTALPDSSRVYLAGLPYSFGRARPFFYVVDTATKAVIAAPTVNAIGQMAASPSGKSVYMSTGSAIAILDTSSNAFTSSLPVSGVGALAFSPDGSTLYAAVGSTLDVIATSTGTITGGFSLGSGTAGAVSVSPDGSQVWVSIAKSSSVLVIETATAVVTTLTLPGTVSGVAFGAQ
jgi:DNA-binding beta-propeller fold protein YncE